MGFFRMAADSDSANAEQDGEVDVDKSEDFGERAAEEDVAAQDDEIPPPEFIGGVNMYDSLSELSAAEESMEDTEKDSSGKNVGGKVDLALSQSVVGMKRRSSETPCYRFNKGEECKYAASVAGDLILPPTTTKPSQPWKFDFESHPMTTGALQKWLSTSTGCNASHVCACCGSSDHGWFECPKREICLEYYNGIGCKGNCGRRHCCVLCHETHPVGDRVSCKLFTKMIVEGVDPESYCFQWNSGKGGRCRTGECKKRHHCVHCSSCSHASFQCGHALNVMFSCEEYGGSLESLHEEKRQKREVIE
jgi:hypothetical protein